ncbi:hypothetical protein HW49_08930 [Porphyromonadaceae bacterium COT-184 OH4590]|nr:hypothetical protein HW49_08930 [Porphyromonadaceae bacterium COT-184 OH4590]
MDFYFNNCVYILEICYLYVFFYIFAIKIIKVPDIMALIQKRMFRPHRHKSIEKFLYLFFSVIQ